MINNNFIGFYENNEFLPKDFDEFNSIPKLRQLFLSLINNIIGCSCKFSKNEQQKLSKYTLKNIFLYKINSLLPISNIKSFNKKSSYHFNFCLQSTKIINNFFNTQSKYTLLMPNKNLLPAAKLISQCFVNNQMQLLIDRHSDKIVLDLGDSICIKSEDFIGLKIYTSWKDIEIKKPNIKNELKNAIKSIKKGEYYQIYLAYPKNNEFTKQIPVFVKELKNKEYQIKAIPYSLRSTIKN